jgi:hypothetical protein
LLCPTPNGMTCMPWSRAPEMCNRTIRFHDYHKMQRKSLRKHNANETLSDVNESRQTVIDGYQSLDCDNITARWCDEWWLVTHAHARTDHGIET